MSKKKYRKGSHILYLDQLVQQEVIYFLDKPYHIGWFGSWQLRWCARQIGPKGNLYYAIKEEKDETGRTLVSV